MRTIAKGTATGLAIVLAGLLPLLALFFTIHAATDLSGDEIPISLVSDAPPPFSLDAVSDDVLWLARCIYSETKRADEQELVAWVIRNRVETGYRGQREYQDVVLDPYQFSAFNPGNPKRRLYTSLAPSADSPAFVQALEVAHAVYHAPASARPFPERTRHFYSERSMVGAKAPNWSAGHVPVRPTGFRVDPKRFRFYSGVAAALRL
ncbi:hypothetical protein [Rubrivirga sp.]|uniref:hypothetical protein n=1 Tax=Rubrivirga sp. TaxID=1885344 RepID=UPI003B51CA9D